VLLLLVDEKSDRNRQPVKTRLVLLLNPQLTVADVDLPLLSDRDCRGTGQPVTLQHARGLIILRVGAGMHRAGPGPP
jgi:hypothetical protein